MPLFTIDLKHGGDLLCKNFVYLAKTLGDVLMNGGF